MRQLLDRASMSFAAGAFGALVNSVAVWAAVAYHLTERIGIGMGPTPNWLYPRIVSGGLCGLLFMLAMERGHWCLRGIILASRRPHSHCSTCFRVRAARAYSTLASAH